MPHAPARRSLEAMLLTVLKKAWREREFEAADHVLRALECLAGEAGAHPHDGLSCLDEGYLIIAEERGGSGKLHSGAEWNFCLTAARMAADQER